MLKDGKRVRMERSQKWNDSMVCLMEIGGHCINFFNPRVVEHVRYLLPSCGDFGYSNNRNNFLMYDHFTVELIVLLQFTCHIYPLTSDSVEFPVF